MMTKSEVLEKMIDASKRYGEVFCSLQNCFECPFSKESDDGCFVALGIDKHHSIDRLNQLYHAAKLEEFLQVLE